MNKDYYIGLPNFIFMTNFCEGRGYEISSIVLDGFYVGRYRFNKGDWKNGSKTFKSQLECQKNVSASIYKKLSK